MWSWPQKAVLSSVTGLYHFTPPQRASANLFLDRRYVLLYWRFCSAFICQHSTTTTIAAPFAIEPKHPHKNHWHCIRVHSTSRNLCTWRCRTFLSRTNKHTVTTDICHRIGAVTVQYYRGIGQGLLRFTKQIAHYVENKRPWMSE